MVEQYKITIPELTGDEERRLYVYLPYTYSHDAEKRYPVLYMFDGHNVFFDEDATYGKCWGLQEYLDYTDTQLIVAAVECNHSKDKGRLKEYSPFPFEEDGIGKITPQGTVTMNWIVNTLKPQIDKQFRTLPDREHTFIAGSSMGGLMSLYAVLSYNHVFSRAAALSPSLWTNTAKMERLARKAKLLPDTMIYLDYGSDEKRYAQEMEEKLKKFIGILMDRQIYVTARIVPKGTHCEACWEKQLPFAITALMYDIS